MGARLQYAKVIDREHFYIRGGRLHPGLHNQVVVADEPGVLPGIFFFGGGWAAKGTLNEQLMHR
jgi:hypothetical protein